MFTIYIYIYNYIYLSIYIYIYIGWWSGTFLFFHILGIIIPTDVHIFSEGVKPPISI